MTDLWYENPNILFDNLDQFFPNNDLSRNQKINSMARFALYYSMILIIFNQDTKWLSVSFIILFISIMLGGAENFTTTDKKLDKSVCQNPTENNPFMNYTLGNLLEDTPRDKACYYDNVKNKIRKEFRSKVHSDSTDIWGQYISDRNFYIMPNTNIVNDQTGFAKWCYGSINECKTNGKDCLKIRDPTYHRGRITTLD